MPSGKLRRRTKDKYIAGVAGGMADWMGLNSFWIRLAWFILFLPGGLPGLIPYIVLWIIIPKEGK